MKTVSEEKMLEREVTEEKPFAELASKSRPGPSEQGQKELPVERFMDALIKEVPVEALSTIRDVHAGLSSYPPKVDQFMDALTKEVPAEALCTIREVHARYKTRQARCRSAGALRTEPLPQ
eukprot:TRINITY_DN20785_c0_g1_i10.p1 TRINITY_DN20785_c0_g1~~TRINITY_DN20785_c0_g1_i10.p1  ORF type:complete len:121 (-),score=6.69 TRINITY_DN20785_c0_g1_i10:198-560(-)